MKIGAPLKKMEIQDKVFIDTLDGHAESTIFLFLPLKFEKSDTGKKIYYKLFDELEGTIYDTIHGPLMDSIELY